MAAGNLDSFHGDGQPGDLASLAFSGFRYDMVSKRYLFPTQLLAHTYEGNTHVSEKLQASAASLQRFFLVIIVFRNDYGLKGDP